MSDYHISQIFKNDVREMKKLEALLEKEGIERDRNLDYTVGLYDDNYHLAATGSCYHNTLRCMAVDEAHQGEGLLNQVVSHLIDYEYRNNVIELFLYTKCDKALFFKDLGFYEIARFDEQVIFMENRKRGFTSYLEHLKEETKQPIETSVGAVIMNANPFTLGHLYLLETAAAACKLLHVFVVSEDMSLVPFSVRLELLKAGSAHIKNLVYHHTGDYIISNATFPSYFLKDEESVIRAHAGLDIAVFAQIAKVLSITTRFVGEEPFSQVTGIYNQVMQEELPKAGITCHVIPRMASALYREGISASTVRNLIHQGNIEGIKDLVPDTTYAYFTSVKAREVVKTLQENGDVIHY